MLRRFVALLLLAAGPCALAPAAAAPPLTVGTLRIDGARAIPAPELLALCRTAPGTAFDPSLLEEDIGRILALYAHRARPFAAVRVAAIEAHSDSALLDVRLAVDEGNEVLLRGILVEGNTSTAAAVVVRETRLALPAPYDEERVAAIAARLRRMNLFDAVAEPELRMTDSGGVLLLRVTEGRTSTFDGVLGYAPAPVAGGEGTVAGLVSVEMRNLFGTARALAVHWQREGGASQETRLRYLEPWLLGAPLNLGGTFEQRQQDSSYVRRAVGGRAELLLSEALSVSGSVRHEVTIPSAGVSAVAASRALTAGIEIAYDSRNDEIAPSAGLYYRNEYRIGDKRTFGASAEALAGPSAFQQLGLDLQWYAPVASRGVVLSALHGRQVTNRHLEPSDLYRFGGTNTLRGFRELQFAGDRIAWTNLEYRQLLGYRSFAYLFFDTGYYTTPADDAAGVSSTQTVTYGYGVGLRTGTALGNIGVSLALGKGDPFSQAKLHIGLLNEF